MSYFKGLLQTNLQVRDIKSSVNWYVQKLQLIVIADYGTTVVLSFSNSSKYEGGIDETPVLCLIENKESPIQSSTYPVLQISDNMCEKLYEHLQQNGVSVEMNPTHHGHFKFYDPDGNVLEAFCPSIYK
ncbi:catechol 2,3-dioxygenase-like lactoylglutathione lyase family enzyme [Bacillus pakistanensis]|uniref:Catechol 2,3-dioxygenase-like lactoylglutathione lyase family enzyme n=1 Tax=Rossellomorea pakistanensis TaxID=992288 RepID=A0ABS2NEE1_9BACI|nr:VOC family protein [Bacillus pakistanensis]MBM7586220.1 catechol 2,3-dioxygenase-like lactoylglutathione lyase family enzyme [Bacillus pakistanensis]